MKPSMISQIVSKIAGLGLAAVVTLTLLNGVSGLADHQYRDAVLAQATSVPAQGTLIAKNEQPGL